MPALNSLVRQAEHSVMPSVAVACGGGVALGALVSMSGWVLGVPSFTDWDGDGITIKFNTTAAAFACGLAIVITSLFPERRLAARSLAAFAFLIGLLTLFQHALGVDFGIDTLVIRDQPIILPGAAEGRMGLPSAISFTMVGAALLLISWRRWLSACSLIGLIVIMIAWLPISGYLYDAPQLYALPPFTGIALQTAFFILFLGIGLIALVPGRGLAEMFSRKDAGGNLFRLLFFPLVALSVVLTWLRLFSIRMHWLDAAESGAIRSVLELASLIGLLWWFASGVSRADAAKASERRAISERDMHRRVNAAQEAERRRIARDLHDSVGQELTGLRLLLSALPDKYDNEKLHVIEQQAARLDAELSMLVWQLRPKVLDAYGLIDALDNFSRAWSTVNGLEVRFECSMHGERLPSEIETNLYRITQEALNNVQKHAEAKCVVISLAPRDGQAVLTVTDDGVGITERKESIHTTESGGFGLMGMRERAAVIGGQLSIESRPGRGTCITVSVPLP